MVLLLKVVNDSGALILIVFQGFIEALVENCNLFLSPFVLLQAVFKECLANLYKFTLVGVVGIKEAKIKLKKKRLLHGMPKADFLPGLKWEPELLPRRRESESVLWEWS